MVEASDILSKLETPLIKIGSDPAQREQLGKPFPLVLSPVSGKVNFIQLQEYFLSHHDLILQAASQYGALMFSGFEIKSGEEWASVMYKSGIK